MNAAGSRRAGARRPRDEAPDVMRVNIGAPARRPGGSSIGGSLPEDATWCDIGECCFRFIYDPRQRPQLLGALQATHPDRNLDRQPEATRIFQHVQTRTRRTKRVATSHLKMTLFGDRM